MKSFFQNGYFSEMYFIIKEKGVLILLKWQTSEGNITLLD